MKSNDYLWKVNSGTCCAVINASRPKQRTAALESCYITRHGVSQGDDSLSDLPRVNIKPYNDNVLILSLYCSSAHMLNGAIYLQYGDTTCVQGASKAIQMLLKGNIQNDQLWSRVFQRVISWLTLNTRLFNKLMIHYITMLLSCTLQEMDYNIILVAGTGDTFAKSPTQIAALARQANLRAAFLFCFENASIEFCTEIMKSHNIQAYIYKSHHIVFTNNT